MSISVLLLSPFRLIAEDHTEFRSAWNKRLSEHQSAYYRISGVKLSWSSEGNAREARRAEVRVDARLDTTEGKFRFDTVVANGTVGLHIYSDHQFHSCLQATGGLWRVSAAKSVTPDADWLYFYPLLLAHGAVPLPPFNVPQISGLDLPKKEFSERSVVRNREAKFEFDGDSPVSISVTHDNLGLVATYRVTRDSQRVIEINNSYETKTGVSQLSGFSVIRFGTDGRPAGRLDAKVEECRLDGPMSSDLFIVPRPPEDVRKHLPALLSRKVQVNGPMTLAELEHAIQQSFGDDVRMRVDENAFSGRHEVRLDRLVFEPGEMTLEELLLKDLQRHRIDFYFDTQGIVLSPRSKAWGQAEIVQYSPGDYGLTSDELRDLVYTTGKHDDWSDVGGQATALLDDDGQLSVLHAQSDHLRFLLRLGELRTE